MSKWDLYNSNFEKANIIIDEQDEVPDGLYHISVNVWIINSKKQLLLIRKTLNYNLHYPGFWTSIDGNVLSGENNVYTVKKVIDDRIGIKVNDNEIKELDIERRDPYHYIFNTFLVNKDIDIGKIKFKDGIAVQSKWIDLKELYNMIENGEIAWVLIPRLEKHIIPLMK